MWEACFEKPIETSVPEKLEKRGTHDVSYQGGAYERMEGLEIFKRGLTPWRMPCIHSALWEVYPWVKYFMCIDRTAKLLLMVMMCNYCIAYWVIKIGNKNMNQTYIYWSSIQDIFWKLAVHETLQATET